MRTIIQTAIVIAALLVAGAVHAATPGPVCREACAPRISRDCGEPGIRGFGKCRRKNDTKTFDGTWAVTVAGGAATLELAVGEPEPRRFAVELDAADNLLVDGRVPTSSSSSRRTTSASAIA